MAADPLYASYEAEIRRLREERQALADELEREIRPLIRKDRSHEGGYDCCGCSTYDMILDHAIAIVRGDPYDGSSAPKGSDG